MIFTTISIGYYGKIYIIKLCMELFIYLLIIKYLIVFYGILCLYIL